MKTNFQIISQLVDEIERRQLNIAPSYQQLVPLAYAIANETSEDGRPLFHRLCQLTPDYRQAQADLLYSQALTRRNDHSGLSTLYLLAQQAGLPIEEKCKNAKMQGGFSLTHTHVPNISEEEEAPGISGTGTINHSDPLSPLPTFAPYAWPDLLCRIMDSAGQSDAQRDLLLLTSFGVLGSCISGNVSVLYSGSSYYPNLQFIAVAPPASGKGVMGLVRTLAEPFHQELREAYRKSLQTYEQELTRLNTLGKEKKNEEMPDKPVNKVYLIPGNNSGTGIMQNIIDSDGNGLIFELEADTLTTAIESEHGKWSDTLRTAFDHQRLSYNRRGNGGEYRETDTVRLSLVVSGTPQQVILLIPSPENGLFSRQLFYYKSGVRHWINQLSSHPVNLQQVFKGYAREWYRQVKLLRRLGQFSLTLTDEQIDAFNDKFSRLYERTQIINSADMPSSVNRLAINLIRIMSIVATLRMLEAYEAQGQTGDRPRSLPYARPADDLQPENKKDGLISHWELSIRPDDFDAVLGMVDVLYDHITHILSFLPSGQISRRSNSEQDRFFAALPTTFTRQDITDVAERMNITANTAISWVQRLSHRPDSPIQRTVRGEYIFVKREKL